MKTDYYAVLGVDSTATAAEIKKAYKRLAHKFHPDKQAGRTAEGQARGAEAFQQIEEAYRVLKDPINRAHFDQTGSGNMPKSKDMAVQKIIHLFQKHVKAALEKEIRQDALDAASVQIGLRVSISNDMDVLIENVRLDLTNEKDSIASALASLQKGVAKLNKYKRKVKSKSDTNLYLQVIEQQLSATQGALAAAGIEKIALETALLFLDDYEYGEIVEDVEWLAIPWFLRNQDNLADEATVECLCEDGQGMTIGPENRCDGCPRWGKGTKNMKIDISTLKVGDTVCYQPAHYDDDTYENGVIKEIRDTNMTGVWVVYNCAGNWGRFKDYTGALTSLRDLTLGWRYS